MIGRQRNKMKIKIDKKIVESWEMYINGYNLHRDSKENLLVIKFKKKQF